MSLCRLWRRMTNESGTAAVEFAMVLPAFAVLIVGGVWMAQMLFETSSLHYAVEAAARCGAVNTVTCSSSTAIENYAASKYYGPSYPAPTFVSTTGACGQSVTGTVTYVLNTGVTSFSVPLSATACFA